MGLNGCLVALFFRWESKSVRLYVEMFSSVVLLSFFDYNVDIWMH